MIFRIPNVNLVGRVCRTNVASNTAFRGFGAPQGMFVAETWMTHVAEFLSMSVEEVSCYHFPTKTHRQNFAFA